MSELARRASDVSTVAFSQLVDGPLVTAERVLERHGRARQCCCLWCACPLSKGVYWALGLLVAEAFVQLILFLARPPWAWRVTPFILVCYLLQVGTRMGLLAISAYAYYKLEQGRSVVFILRMQLRGLIWRVSCRSNPALRPQPRRDADLGSLSRRRLCLLELVVMIASLAEERLLCEAPLVEDMRNRHDPNVVDSEPLCELESDAYDLVRSILSVGILGYCAWIIHSLARGLMDSSSLGAGRSGRMLQRVTSLAPYRPNAESSGAGSAAGAAEPTDAPPVSAPSAAEDLEWQPAEAPADPAEPAPHAPRGKKRLGKKRLGKKSQAGTDPAGGASASKSRLPRRLSKSGSKGRETRTKTHPTVALGEVALPPV